MEWLCWLLNVENDQDGVVERGVVEVYNGNGSRESDKEDEKREGEWSNGAGGVKKMMEICNMVVNEGKIPRDWELSTLILIYKG